MRWQQCPGVGASSLFHELLHPCAHGFRSSCIHVRMHDAAHGFTRYCNAFIIAWINELTVTHEGVGCGGSARGWREFMISRVAGFTSLPSDGGVEQWFWQHWNSQILGDHGGITGYHGGITRVSRGYHRFEHTTQLLIWSCSLARECLHASPSGNSNCSRAALGAGGLRSCQQGLGLSPGLPPLPRRFRIEPIECQLCDWVALCFAHVSSRRVRRVLWPVHVTTGRVPDIALIIEMVQAKC